MPVFIGFQPTLSLCYSAPKNSDCNWDKMALNRMDQCTAPKNKLFGPFILYIFQHDICELIEFYPGNNHGRGLLPDNSIFNKARKN